LQQVVAGSQPSSRCWVCARAAGFVLVDGRGLGSVPIMGLDNWAEAQPLRSERLVLEPLRVEHADEMAPLLDDPTLHTFTGGKPATLQELRSRYAQQVVGQPPDGSQHWLNWIARRRDNGQAVGFVQATISEQDGDLTADVAWVIGVSQQRSGYAREAAQLMTDWLRLQHVRLVVAHVHPQHHASNAVARWIGLTPTDTQVEGEVRWQG
jgi:RimJ/RimL family protein N-acetyltransferase